MLRQRGSGLGGELPTTLSQPSDKVPDGSVKSIRIETPLAKAIRSADGFTKGSYAWLFVSVLFIWGGWTWIRRNSSSMVLDCRPEGCRLTIHTPHRFLPRNLADVSAGPGGKSRRKTTVELERDQLVRADNVKWDPRSRLIVENYGADSPTYTSHQKKKNEDGGEEGDEEEGGDPDKLPGRPRDLHKKKPKTYKKYKKSDPSMYRSGLPDTDGNYDSYVVILRDPTPPNFEEIIDPEESPSMRMARRMQAQHEFMEHDPSSLANVLAAFAVPPAGPGGHASIEYAIHPRDFNVGQTRRLARSSVAKVNAYAGGRRNSFVVRETRPVAWQGLVLLILGTFSLVLSLLLGQFWEEHDPTRVGSYRKRMAEIRKREEARKLRQRKGSVRRPPLRRPGGRQPLLRRPDGLPSGVARGTSAQDSGGALSDGASEGKAEGPAARGTSDRSLRARPNAVAAVAKDRGNGDESSWVGSMGGVAQAYSKRKN